MTIWTLPNLITFARLLLVPFVAWHLAVGNFVVAFWLFAMAGLSDLLDGMLARWLNQRSEFGAWLDPVADKLMLLSTMIMLTWDGLLPMWFAVLVLVRDGIVIGGAAAYRRLTGGLQVSPTWLGKSAIFLEFLLVSATLVEAALQLGLAGVLPQLLSATAAMAVVSGVQYVWLWSAKTLGYLRIRS